MIRRMAVTLLALAASTAACAGAWGTVSQRRAPEPDARPTQVRVLMRGGGAVVLSHALVYPDSVLEMQMVDGTPVRVRSIPGEQIRRVEQWESGAGRSAAVVAVAAAGSMWITLLLIHVLAAELK
jgi:hypothetical protein